MAQTMRCRPQANESQKNTLWRITTGCEQENTTPFQTSSRPNFIAAFAGI